MVHRKYYKKTEYHYNHHLSHLLFEYLLQEDELLNHQHLVRPTCSHHQ